MNEMHEIRKAVQELANVVVKQSTNVDNFIKSQGLCNLEIKEMIRTQREEMKEKISELKTDHCERLNKHSEKLEKHGNELSEIRGSSKAISFFISLFVSILSIVMGKIIKW